LGTQQAQFVSTRALQRCSLLEIQHWPFAICDVKIPFVRRTLIDQMTQGFATEPKARPYGWVGLAVSLIAIPIVAVLVSIALGAKTSLREDLD